MPYQETIFDLVGLGFGPANIAIAGALTEHWQDNDSASSSMKNVLFIEKHSNFRWHPGMLLPDARMQISFMKDLATLRNPGSPYTFLAYLHSQGRLLPFINRGSTVPTRKEYSDYLSWAAKRVEEEGINVLYGHEVVHINEGIEDTIAVHYRSVSTGNEVVVRTLQSSSAQSVYVAGNIIISPGGSPRIPAVMSHVTNHPRVIHSSAYCTSITKILESIRGISASRPLRVAVVGSGQSAAEVTMDLRSLLNDIPCTAGRHQVDMLIRKGSLKPSDDSPFANEIFDPAASATDMWFGLSSKRMRDIKLAEYKSTNYGVVNPRTLDSFYDIIYGQRVNECIAERTGEDATRSETTIEIKPYTSLSSIRAGNSDASKDMLLSPDITVTDQTPLIVTTQNLASHDIGEERYDAIVYATGYVRSSWVDLLKNSNIGKHFGLDHLSSNVSLVPSRDEDLHASQPVSFTSSRSNSAGSTPPSSAGSTPPTSPEMGTLASETLEKRSQQLFINRNYRLMPKDGPQFLPRIYVQGVEESTHGLSDTLLSVLGVRAGEVVADLTRL
ncbi:hypothetical protein HYPSUDRAFT_51897 [Hypholoma sublateritium FD-334 SS-4]|uniref:L-ornithine N(5)-monooxygenase [NAD(P)H] n=1 Tax=Hypholoma sublateritium (strain FD-334 SS-4) TaxID=945553 RepID=A0A0D2LI69_HYPSF|nr:hypothetical protein HYPSUDRAFT_51897 [Hypholoma sublateritium FD-334 SS-4]